MTDTHDVERLEDLLARDYDHLTTFDAETKDWLFNQMVKWPSRVHPDRTTNHRFLVHSALSLISQQAERIEKLDKRDRRTLSDPQRLLWRDDVEGICPTPGACWEYGDTARCGPCAIKQAAALGVESNMSLPNLPEVYRLRRLLKTLNPSGDTPCS